MDIRVWDKNCSVIIWSRVEQFFLKPAWLSLITSISDAYIFNLLLNIQVKSFPRQLNIVIGLQFSGCVGSSLFLYMGFTIPTSHSSGIKPLSKIILNNLLYKGRNKETVAEMCSLSTSSYPAALLFLSFFTASNISSSPMVLLRQHQTFRFQHSIKNHYILYWVHRHFHNHLYLLSNQTYY